MRTADRDFRDTAARGELSIDARTLRRWDDTRQRIHRRAFILASLTLTMIVLAAHLAHADTLVINHQSGTEVINGDFRVDDMDAHIVDMDVTDYQSFAYDRIMAATLDYIPSPWTVRLTGTDEGGPYDVTFTYHCAGARIAAGSVILQCAE